MERKQQRMELLWCTFLIQSWAQEYKFRRAVWFAKLHWQRMIFVNSVTNLFFFLISALFNLLFFAIPIQLKPGRITFRNMVAGDAGAASDPAEDGSARFASSKKVPSITRSLFPPLIVHAHTFVEGICASSRAFAWAADLRVHLGGGHP